SQKNAASTTPAFLSNLGRATLRGIRKCPQCGVYNGTRGLSCKNKVCGISLRNASSAAVLGGGGGSSAGVQVFSVCHRGRGATATQLGFVELVPTDTAIATGDGATLLTRINLGRCFLPSCRQGQSLCVHIKQAIECRSRSTPLTLKSSVLEGLQASIQARKELWRLATESPGPLVQRVAKDTLVVKCHVDSQHPLGLLHLTVGQQVHAVFHCACQVGGGRKSKPGVDAAGGSAGSHPPSPGPVAPQPCLHFYACVCAFASDEKLASEFASFIKYTPVVGPSEKPLQQADPLNSPLRTKKLRLDESLSGSFIAIRPQNICRHSSFLLFLSLSLPSCRSLISCLSLGRRKTPGAGGLKAPGSQVVDERTVTMGFQQWLAGVTERIHQTMHYQFDGKPQPLVFHIPQEFFIALQQRLSLGSKKRRLPNFTTALVKNDGLPLGSFSKYTWHVTNLLQVKRIFDTSELPLELSQSFVRNADGSYSRFRCPEPPPPEPEPPEGCRTDRPQAIRPMELRTFLKVGEWRPADQKEAAPFVIEWIPDVLPHCHMGELRIAFEFGHHRWRHAPPLPQRDKSVTSCTTIYKMTSNGKSWSTGG
uniref:Chromosome 2 open reading frame 42 n=1 Tax=Cyclopterus lumpus TaxID=8103 RepID=A0A8C2XRG1_CYCLU